MTTRDGSLCPRVSASGSVPQFVLTIAPPILVSRSIRAPRGSSSAAGSKPCRERTSAIGAICATSSPTPKRSACDAQGRVVVPALLRAYAGIERHVVSVGLLTRVEIWAKERYAFETPPEGDVPRFMAELGL